MEQLLFRHLIPGLFLLLPIYLSMILLGNRLPIPSEFVNMATAVFTSLVLPVGYIFYQFYRIVWQVIGGGYEKLPFVNIVRDNLKAYNQPHLSRVVVDFSEVLPQFGMRWFGYSEFIIAFDPFSPQVSKVNFPIGFNSKNNRSIRANGRKHFFHFLEHVSDIILFDQPSYGYARSVSSARYSTHASRAAFFVGLILASGLFLIGFENSNSDIFITLAFVLGVSFFVALLFLLSIRTSYSNSEYNARVTLLTILNLSEREIQASEFKNTLPQALVEKLSQINSQPKYAKIAAFDMDDTLLIGDIGDAVFAQLVLENKLSSQHWIQYASLLKENKTEAYKYAVKVLAGLNVDDVYQATNMVINSPNPAIILDELNVQVPVPIPDPILQSFLIEVRLNGFDVYVVTATNIWSAQVIGAEYFGLPKPHIIGMQTALVPNSKSGEITPNLLEPIPIGDGKSQALKKFTNNIIIAAGNSKQDFSLLQMIDEDGLAIWVGNDDSIINSLRANLGDKKELLVIDR
ncbi:MAG: haloacid dehalogenase-like hydrolase [Anaerolineae bacterium]|nr:haloacid dehalogenase-like hydrolase [Anaerolineae bacterium]MBT7075181.1 haloacid dehalogenase-like hydrolase [Anaerolineae bacterium]MBT7783906.1 haloacid dehalogenase-like hydrolase [Anaerolineae bacterium]